MKKIFTFFVFILAIHTLATAQFSSGGPKFSFSSATPCTGEEFCVDVTIEDFTDITSVKFPVKWDPQVLEFVGVNGLNLVGLEEADFDITRVDSGLVILDWEFEVCSLATQGVTLGDDIVIFQLCFRAIASYGETTSLEIINDNELTGDPEPILVRRLNVCNSNIGLRQDAAFISTCVVPMSLIASNAQGNTGDLVFVDVSTSGFNNLNSMQFSMNWDTTALRFDQIIVLENLTGLTISGFGRPDEPNIGPGKLTVSWSFIDPERPGITLPDSTSIFQVGFKIVGDCETSSMVEFTGDPTPIEAINSRDENGQEVLSDVPLQLISGTVEVGKCDPGGLLLFADCGPEKGLGEEVCVLVTAGALENLSRFKYLMEWNANILKFKEVRNINNTNIPGFLASDFDVNNVANGILGVEWQSPSPTTAPDISDGTPLYEVCFEVVGLGGNSPFRFDVSSANVRQAGSVLNIGIFPSNCEVQVIQPDNVQIRLSEVQGPPGETVCVDITAANFTNLVNFQFSLGWEPNALRYIGVQNLNSALTNAVIFDSPSADFGTFAFDWEGNATTFTEDEVLFSLCFEVIGTPPGELGLERNCTEIIVLNDPLEIQAVSVESNGNNIATEDIHVDGEACILNPEGFFLVIGQEDAYKLSQACIPFKVGEFDSITSAQFNINWDPTLLAFDSITNITNRIDLEVGPNLNISSAGVGLIGFDWEDPAGVNLPDSTVLFEVCYTAIGDANQCADIEVNSDPTPSVTTLNGAGSVFPIGGQICIQDTLIVVNSFITAVTCPGGRDGTIELEVEGGSGPIFFNWQSIPTQFLPKAINLPVGKVAVTIFDSSVPRPLVTRDTFEIPLSANLPEADAGPDRMLNCEGAIILEGEGSQGDEYDYVWELLGGDLPGDPTRLSAFANRPGTYVLKVINSETGCVAADSARVTEPELPIADAGNDVFFTCADSIKVLDAGNSSQADTISYQWTALDGGVLEPGDENVLNPRVRTSGIYALEVTFTNSGCSATDTVNVVSVEEYPVITAGNDLELTCDTNGVQLLGRVDNNVRDFSFDWFNSSGQLVGSNDLISVKEAGAYILQVTDLENFCSTTDTVMVTPSDDVPVIAVSDSLAIDCNNPTLSLNASVQSNNLFEFSWEALDGGMFDPGTDTSLSPVAIAPGTFVLSVLDTATDCRATDTVRVSSQLEIPTVEAGSGGTITCLEPSVQLSGQAAGESLSISWLLNGQLVKSDSLTFEALSPGTYILNVLNTLTGCSNVDSVVVESAGDIPEISFLEVPSLTCNINQVVLNAQVLPATGVYTSQWQVIEGGSILSGEGTLSPTVNAAGTYRIEVTNESTGCTGTNEIIVAADTLPPVVSAGSDRTLTCSTDSVILDAIGTAEGSTIQYNWTSASGGPAPVPATSLQPLVFNPGTFILEVTDTETGCVGVDSVVVAPDTALPSVQLAVPDQLTCTVPSVMLSGAGSDQGNEYAIRWEAAAGQNTPQLGNSPLEASVTEGGAYLLRITNLLTGCESTGTVEVFEDRTPPVADAGQTVTILCPGNAVPLNGSNSSAGTIFTYEWTTVSGGAIVNPTSITPAVDQPGTYELMVTNIENGCSSTATVIAQLDPNLSEASAGTDDFTCENEAILFAEQPVGATGQWSTTGPGIIDIPTEASSGVSNLQPGTNIFVWTLSTTDCPNYSSDSVRIERVQAPSARGDETTLSVGSTQTTINLSGNDAINSQSGFTLTIQNRPSLGALDSVINGGNVTYRVAQGINGEDIFSYRICSGDCPNLCDTAFVSVIVPFDPDYEPELVNGITPNGDGVNDELRFEVLEVDPNTFPDNELTIFNRWGDIVYKARPYLNDWRGKSTGGQDLPDGTYYYILRLDISEGIIIKGDVTIIKN